MSEHSSDRATDCAPGLWWGRVSPGPWAALVWVPLMLAAPAAAMGRNVVGWVGLVVVAATAVAALFTAFGRRGRRGRLPDALLAVQALATVVTVTTLPVDVSLWLWVLLGLSLGAAAHPWWGPWAIIATALLAASWLGFALGWGGAVGGAFTVLASGFGTYAFYRLTEVVAELHRTRAELAAVAVREERQRMSRDLHDLLGHSLSLIVVKAEAVRRVGPTDPDAVVAHARDIESIGRRALTQVRQAVAGYRGNGLADELAGAEEALLAAGVTGVVEAPDPLPPAVAADATLGWVVREAVTNVLRHAQASSCRIVIGVGRGRASVSIIDDGVGSDTSADGAGARPATLSTGMRGLTERVRAVGGAVTVDAEPGRGRRVSAWVPLAATTSAADAEPSATPADDTAADATDDSVADDGATRPPARSPVSGGRTAR
ncbi:MAG TPA: sensor histidine kinase [Lapillicoccus sp.]